MKRFIITLLLLFFAFQIHAQDTKESDEKGAISYLVRNVLLRFMDSGGIVLVPHPAFEIRHLDPTREVQYWAILNKYLPGISKDSLYRKVDGAPWLDTSVRVSRFKIYFPGITKGEYFNYSRLFDQYNVSVYSVSNPVFSNDRTVCIVYLGGFEAGGFTVEIKKDRFGKWASFTTTADWLE